MRVFLAGATGVIGRRMLPLLLAQGHTVIATTRSPDKARELAALGVAPVVVDALDAPALRTAVAEAHPEIVYHQLTDLPQTLDPPAMEASLARNAKLRVEATPVLVEAAARAGARRLIAQSIAFAYAPGEGARREDDPLDHAAEGARAMSVSGVVALELAVLGAPALEGIVLRYGRLYGPGTWYAAPEGKGSLHVDAAAHAALLALDRGAPGIYNIAEDDGALLIDKARRALKFDPDARIELGR